MAERGRHYSQLPASLPSKANLLVQKLKGLHNRMRIVIHRLADPK
jgi:hypothetical protein